MPTTSFDAQPILASSLIKVRPLLLEDKTALFAVASDPLIWAQHPTLDRHTAAGFDSFFNESIQSGGALLIIDAQTEEVIGSSRYFGYNPQSSDVEIGWTFLARSHWGGQYNADLKQLMFDHAYHYVDAVVFYIDPDNIRSQKSVEKLGGKREAGLDSAGRVVYRVRKSN